MTPANILKRLSLLRAAGPILGGTFFTLLLIAGLWLSVTKLIEIERAEKISSVMKENTNLVRSLEEHTSSTLNYIDENLLSLQRQYEAEGDRFDLDATVKRERLNAKIIRNVAVTDDKGILTQSINNVTLKSNVDLRAPSIADRKRIGIHLESDTGLPFIDEPSLGRTSHEWSIGITRRANRSDGSLLGVVSIGVDPFYFLNFYKDIDLGPNSVVALTGLDGILRARVGDGPLSLGLDVSKGEVFKQAAASPNASYIAAAASDGITRVFSSRHVRDYPLYVSVASSMEHVLSQVNYQARIYRGFAALLSIAIVIFAASLIALAVKAVKAKKAEEMFNQHLRAIADNLPAHIAYVDQDRRIQFINKTGAEWNGKTIRDMIGKTPEDLEISPQFVSGAADFEDQPEGPCKYEHTLQYPDGVIRTVDHVAIPDKGPEGIVRGYYHLGRDITDRKMVERNLIAAKTAAEAGNIAKTQFLTSMSHELCTPLNAIVGFSDILEMEMKGPLGHEDYKGYVRDIRDSSRHLHALISDVIDYSKIEAGHQEPLNEEFVDLKEMTDSCLALMAEKAATANVNTANHISHFVPIIRADKLKLKRILVNLLSNAIKFTPAGGDVTIDARVDGEGISIAVTDTGIGIAPEDTSRVLLPFVQLETSNGRRASGTGLGLSLAQSLAQLHGGSLKVSSQVGVGTTVTINLPASRVATSMVA